MKLTIVALKLLAVSAFMSPSVVTRHASPLFMSTTVENVAPITVTGNNIDLTPALVEYINKKLERPLGKLRANGNIKDCSVHLIVNKNPKVKNAHRIEVNTQITGTTIHSSAESPDMYASIDAVSDRLSRTLRKFKERRAAGWHGGIKQGSAAAMGDDDDDILTDALNSIEPVEGDDSDAMVMFEDPGKPEVTKIRSFDLSKPISMEEAIFALDYVDHDFYVYTDATSGEVNVVYKRNAGGIGLIQPEQ